MFGMTISSSATVIDTTAEWDGTVSSGWDASGQSLTVGAVESHFDSIGFYFDEESWGMSFNLLLSDAMIGGNTLFSTVFDVVSGINVINIDKNMIANSMVYAMIDYNGYYGLAAHISSNDSYDGGNSFFVLYDSPEYIYASYTDYDHRFIAEFSEESASTPEPAAMLLIGTGLATLGIKKRKNVL